MAITEEDVRRAYYATAGAPQTWWITELQMAPTQLIVADEADGKIYRVPFAINGAAVEFGSADEVASYEDVAATRGTGPVMVYASAEESRSVMVEAEADSGDTGGDQGAGDGQDEGQDDGGGLDSSWDGELPAGLDLSGISIADLEAALAEETGTAAASADTDILAMETEEGQGLVTVEAAAKLGTGARFAALTSKLAAKGAKAPKALAAWIGRKKFGKAKFAGLAKRAKAKHASADGTEPGTHEGPGSVVEAAGDGGHGPHTGEHTHAHAAYGTQGDDETHEHMHRHTNDAVHQHAHDPVSSAAPAAATTQEGGGHSDMEFTNQHMAAIRRRLGKSETDPVTPDEVVAAMEVPRAPTIAAAAAGEAGDGPVEVPQIADGTYLVDGEILREYQKRAMAGDRAVHTLHVAERDTILASAIVEGKFAQSRRDHFKALWDRDPDGTRKLVASLAPNLVPMVAAGSNGEFSADPDMPGDFEQQAAYRALYGDDDKARAAR